jgi:hypothetical protein
MVQLSVLMGRWIHEIEELPISELAEYMAEYCIEPYGQARDDIRTAYAAAVSYNLMRPHKARGRRPAEFMVDWTPRVQSAEHIKNVLFMFARAHNASLGKGHGQHN